LNRAVSAKCISLPNSGTESNPQRLKPIRGGAVVARLKSCPSSAWDSRRPSEFGKGEQQHPSAAKADHGRCRCGTTEVVPFPCGGLSPPIRVRQGRATASPQRLKPIMDGAVGARLKSCPSRAGDPRRPPELGTGGQPHPTAAEDERGRSRDAL